MCSLHGHYVKHRQCVHYTDIMSNTDNVFITRTLRQTQTILCPQNINACVITLQKEQTKYMGVMYTKYALKGKSILYHYKSPLNCRSRFSVHPPPIPHIFLISHPSALTLVGCRVQCEITTG